MKFKEFEPLKEDIFDKNTNKDEIKNKIDSGAEAKKTENIENQNPLKFENTGTNKSQERIVYYDLTSEKLSDIRAESSLKATDYYNSEKSKVEYFDMVSDIRYKGIKGEELAREYLKNEGVTILNENKDLSTTGPDIVGIKKDGNLVVCEVFGGDTEKDFNKQNLYMTDKRELNGYLNEIEKSINIDKEKQTFQKAINNIEKIVIITGDGTVNNIPEDAKVIRLMPRFGKLENS